MLNKRRIFKKNKTLAVDEFVDKVLYDRKFGYYSKKNPFGNKGDFITSPLIIIILLLKLNFLGLLSM